MFDVKNNGYKKINTNEKTNCVKEVLNIRIPQNIYTCYFIDVNEFYQFTILLYVSMISFNGNSLLVTNGAVFVVKYDTLW